MLTFKTSDSISLSYETWSGNKRGFLLVHGLASNSQLWAGVANELSRAGHRVAALDLRGHGRSDKISFGYDYDRISLDLLELIQVLKAADPQWASPILVGQSWGGSVVEAFAARYGEHCSGIACIDGGIGSLKDVFPSWKECEISLSPPRPQGLTRRDFERLIRQAHPDWSTLAIEGTLANMNVQPDGTITANLSFANHMTILAELWSFNPVTELSGIKTPLLFMPALSASASFRLDKLAEISKIANVVKGACEIHPFNGADHDIHAQHPLEVASLLIDGCSTGGVFQ